MTSKLGSVWKEMKKQNPDMSGRNEVSHELPQNYRRHGQDSNQVSPEYTS